MNLVYLEKEHSLNKVLKNQKVENSNIKILFVSLWDSYSTALLEKLDKCPSKETDPKLYVVDSYHMPHSFVIFKTTKLPHLVTLKGRKSSEIDYLPKIYEELNIK